MSAIAAAAISAGAALAGAGTSAAATGKMNAANRAFSAQQAQINRDWQEEYYQKYLSPSAQVQQFRAAGINPALMYEGGYHSGSVPSGGSASPNTHPYTFNLQDIAMNAINLKEQIKMNESLQNLQNAQAENQLASAAEASSQAAVNDVVKELTKKEMKHVDEKINLLQKQASTEDERKLLVIADRAFRQASTEQVSLQNAVSKQFKELTGFDADAKTIGSFIIGIGALVGGASNAFINSIFKRIPIGKGKTSKTGPGITQPKLKFNKDYTGATVTY